MHSKSVVGFLGFFAVLAFLVPYARAHGMGMEGMFFAIIGAGSVAIGVPWSFKAIGLALRQRGLSWRVLGAFMVGGYEIPVTASTRTVEASPLYLEAPDVAPPLTEDDARFIAESNVLYFSDNFQPGIKSFLSFCALLCGIRRSGKSNGVAVLIEELGRWGVPLLILDTENEYGALADRQYLPRYGLAGSTEVEVADRVHYTTLDTNNAFDYAQAVMENGAQAIVLLKSYASDDEAASVMIELLAGIEAWEAARSPHDRVPCSIVLDEANKWLPQRENETVLSRSVFTQLQQSFFGLVRRGGKYGIGLIFVTQRLAELDKRALQSEWHFVFRQTEENDLAHCLRLGLTREQVQMLSTGECYVFGPDVNGLKVRMRLRYSPHGAVTPGLEAIEKHTARLSSIPPQGTYVPPTPRSAPAPTTERLPELQEVKRQPRLSPDLQRALEAHNAGHKSVRLKASALAMSRDKAHRLQRELKELGLI